MPTKKPTKTKPKKRTNELLDTVVKKSTDLFNDIYKNPKLLDNKEIGESVTKIFQKIVSKELSRKKEFVDNIEQNNTRHNLKFIKAKQDLVLLYEDKLEYIELVLDKNYVASNNITQTKEYSSIFIKKTTLMSTTADMIEFLKIKSVARLRVCGLHQQQYGSYIPPEFASFKNIYDDTTFAEHFLRKLCYFVNDNGDYIPITSLKVNQLGINDFIILCSIVEEILSFEIPNNTMLENVASFLA